MRWLLASVAIILAMIALARFWIQLDTEKRVYTSSSAIPKRQVGLVLGCSSHLAGGYFNFYFLHRIHAAYQLYNAGKVDYLLVSGDNHISTYDEAGAMKAALVKLGIPPEKIICDYAGFSTMDSVVRARKVFGQDQITIISQQFHVQRALFIAKRKQIDAIGYCAADVSSRAGFRTQLREQLARVKTILDLYIIHRKPVYLGKPVHIG